VKQVPVLESMHAYQLSPSNLRNPVYSALVSTDRSLGFMHRDTDGLRMKCPPRALSLSIAVKNCREKVVFHGGVLGMIK